MARALEQAAASAANPPHEGVGSGTLLGLGEPEVATQRIETLSASAVPPEVNAALPVRPPGFEPHGVALAQHPPSGLAERDALHLHGGRPAPRRSATAAWLLGGLALLGLTAGGVGAAVLFSFVSLGEMGVPDAEPVPARAVPEQTSSPSSAPLPSGTVPDTTTSGPESAPAAAPASTRSTAAASARATATPTARGPEPNPPIEEYGF